MKAYPTSFGQNIKYRAEILKSCELKPELADKVKVLCFKDILFWINIFCQTKDPRRKPDVLPFLTYPFQDIHILELKNSIEQGNDLLIEKSRDMGASWMVLYVFTWFWLFHKGSDFRVGSRKEDFVDKLNDIDTLLEKVRFTLKHMPKFLLPQGFNPDEHCAYMRIINPENGNTIIGESANPHFGSGGRRKALLLDEFAKWDNSVADAAWTATADVSKCRIVLSTPVGSANRFAQLANGSKEKIKKLSLHWTLHPLKAKDCYYLNADQKIPVPFENANNLHKQGIKVRSTWYDAEAERRSAADLAQEVDIDYLRSGFPFFDIQALAKQKPWEYYKRKFITDAIPYGNYIRVKLVDIDNKIEVRELEGEWLRVFELPKPGAQYVVSADVSEGLAKGDEAFIVVREKWSRNVVAAANGLYPPDDVAVKVDIVSRYYNQADAAVENNNHGFSVNSDLQKLNCKLYWSKRIPPNGSETIVKAGWTTDVRSRPAMLDQLEEEIRKGIFEIRDETLINQCKTFVKNEKTGKPEADGNFLDDGVMACYDDKTRVLTNVGWKYFKDVKEGELIPSLNLGLNKVELAKNMRTIEIDYSGEMISFSGRGIDLLVTPNHRMLASLSEGGNTYGAFYLIEAKDLIKRHFKLKKNAIWNGVKRNFWVIPSLDNKHNYNKRERKIPIKTFLTLLGFYISEGSGNNNRINISQKSYSKGWNSIKECCEELKVSYVEDKDSGFVIHDTQISYYIKKLIPGLCYDKRIPREILELDCSLLKHLYNSLMLGDGSQERIYVTTSVGLKDDFIELVNKLGWSTTYKVYNNRTGGYIKDRKISAKSLCYVLSINKTQLNPRINHHKNFGGSAIVTGYKGKVFCLSLEKNHTMLVERNGRTCWCGNCAIGSAIIKELPYKPKASLDIQQARAYEEAGQPLFTY